MTPIPPSPIEGTCDIALFGHPVSHSLSPSMHNAAFAALQLPFRYTAIEVRPDELAEAVTWIRSGILGGANLTIPHKEGALKLVDRVDPIAAASGAVNTIVKEGDELIGFDTDGPGYLVDLAKSLGFSPADKRVVLIGAGGAARAIATALAKEGCRSLVIAARRAEAAQALATSLPSGMESAVRHLGHEPLWSNNEPPDLVINATPLGLQQVKGRSGWEEALHEIEDWLPEVSTPGTLYSDLIYTPRHTPFLQAGASRGAASHGGIGMLLHQGALGFEKWTGATAPIELMREALEKALDG